MPQPTLGPRRRASKVGGATKRTGLSELTSKNASSQPRTGTRVFLPASRAPEDRARDGGGNARVPGGAVVSGHPLHAGNPSPGDAVWGAGGRVRARGGTGDGCSVPSQAGFDLGHEESKTLTCASAPARASASLTPTVTLGRDHGPAAPGPHLRENWSHDTASGESAGTADTEGQGEAWLLGPGHGPDSSLAARFDLERSARAGAEVGRAGGLGEDDAPPGEAGGRQAGATSRLGRILAVLPLSKIKILIGGSVFGCVCVWGRERLRCRGSPLGSQRLSLSRGLPETDRISAVFRGIRPLPVASASPAASSYDTVCLSRSEHEAASQRSVERTWTDPLGYHADQCSTRPHALRPPSLLDSRTRSWTPRVTIL